MSTLEFIRFAFHKITTDQFAVIDDIFIPGKEVTVYSNLQYNFSSVDSIIDVQSNVQFDQDDKVFLKLSVSCFFQIPEEDWKLIYNPHSNSYVLPVNPARHLASIVTSLSRGILHAKTENTPFNQLILPPVNLQELITEDVEVIVKPVVTGH